MRATSESHVHIRQTAVEFTANCWSRAIICKDDAGTFSDACRRCTQLAGRFPYQSPRIYRCNWKRPFSSLVIRSVREPTERVSGVSSGVTAVWECENGDLTPAACCRVMSKYPLVKFIDQISNETAQTLSYSTLHRLESFAPVQELPAKSKVSIFDDTLPRQMAHQIALLRKWSRHRLLDNNKSVCTYCVYV